MNNIDETLKKAREIDERYKQFLEKEIIRKKSVEETFNKIEIASKSLEETKKTLKQIDLLYENYQESFSKIVDKMMDSMEKNVSLNIASPDFEPNFINEVEIAKCLLDKKQITVLSGAGISAASGIPTFRGPNGYWNKQDSECKSPEEILTLEYYKENPFKTWQWLEQFYEVKKKCLPNGAHEALSVIIQKLKEKNIEVCIVTQNIDNYDFEIQKERQKTDKSLLNYEIFEVHGNITKIRCDSCSKERQELIYYSYEDYRNKIIKKETLECPKCKTELRPHIMFFDETYEEHINQSETVHKFLIESELLLVIGTSLQTGLANNLVRTALNKKIQIIEINLECEIKKNSSFWFEGKAEVCLEKIKYELFKI